MAKDSRRTLKGSAGSVKTVSSHRGVTVGRDYVTVRYRSGNGNRTVRLSKSSILESGRAALAGVPVIFD